MQTPTETAHDLDSLLIDLLEEDLLAILLIPPRLPLFALDTVRPAKAVAS